MENQLTVKGQNDIATIAQVDPSTAWLYTGGNRISIDNDHRDGFIVKGTDEKLSELRAIIGTAVQLNSHKQPDEKRDAPRHNDAVDWCESRDGKQTNSQGKPCGDCPAFAECKWKIELSLLIADRENEYLMTIPTASSMRFKSAVADLAKQHKRHFSQVVWRMWISVEKSGGNVFPVVNFEPLDPDSGQPLTKADAPKLNAPDVSGTPSAPQKKSGTTLTVEHGFNMDAFRDQVSALTGDYYRDPKSGKPNPFHINKTIIKLGFTAIGQGNANEVLAALQAYAADNEGK